MVLYSKKYFLLLILLSLFMTRLVFASEELDSLKQQWPTDEPPLSDWSVVEADENIAEFLLQLQHSKTGEKFSIGLHRRSETENSYAKSRLYNIFYILDNQGRYTSPEVELLLPELANWVKSVEGEQTLLPDYKTSMEAEKARIEREKSNRIERKKLEKQRFLTMKRYGIRRLLGDGLQQQNIFGENILVLILLALSFLFMVPRINSLTNEIEVADVNYIKLWTKHFLPVFSFLYAFVFFRIPFNESLKFVNQESSPGARVVGFILKSILPNGYISPDTTYRILVLLLFMAAALMVCYAAYILSWNRILAVYALFAYCLVSLLRMYFIGEHSVITGLVTDFALAVMFISLSFYAYSDERDWIVCFSGFAATLAIWLEPAYYVLVLFIPVYIVLESEHLKQSLTSYKGWLVYLFVIIFSLPVFQLLVPDNPLLTIADVFAGSYSDVITAENLVNYVIVPLAVVLSLLAFSVIIERKLRTVFIYLMLFSAFTYLAATGLPDFKNSNVTRMTIVALPAIILGYISYTVHIMIKKR